MSLLSLTQDEASRRIAIALVRDAAAALPRVAGRTDPEALHDLRVALRRLRSILRAFDAPLGGSLSKKQRKRLRELAAETGEARDSEVQLVWAGTMLDGSLEPEERVAVTYLRDRWAARRDAAFAHIDGGVVPRLARLLPRLERDLGTYSTEHVVFSNAPAGASLGVLVATLAGGEMGALSACLRRVRSIDDEAVAHEARIHGKRLRYLLEPFRDERAEVDAAVRTLRGLQELLGDLNDRAVRTAEITTALEALATSHVRDLAREAQGEWEPMSSEVHAEAVQPGLLSILRREGLRKLETFEALLGDWIDGAGLSDLEASVEALAAALRTSEAPREIERKFLLRSLPPRAESAPAAQLDQGYLPGEKLIERVRRIKDARGERYLRTVKLGAGISRIEVEEPCSRFLFHKLWALTKGRRVQKLRYAIEEGALTWEIDAFTDRTLFLAEVELPSEDTEVVIPDWLAPHVVRDVTDESTYVNARLAR